MKWLAYTTAKMGAWCVSDYETGKAIARMSDSCTSAENEKTARLIAAAPDLLAALESLLVAHEAYHIAAQAGVIGTATARMLFEKDETVIETRAAIAKAKGEQS